MSAKCTKVVVVIARCNALNSESCTFLGCSIFLGAYHVGVGFQVAYEEYDRSLILVRDGSLAA